VFWYFSVMDSLSRAKQKIQAVIAKSPVPEDPIHSLLQLEPEADEALIIAALGHDIDRAIEASRAQKADYEDFNAFKTAHALHSAQILRTIMAECEVPPNVADEVYRLVSKHETGGGRRSDLLKEADSLSYFEVNLPLYFQRHGWEESLRRSAWGYRRLSPGTQKIVRGFHYQDEELNRLLEAVPERAGRSF